MEQHEIDGASCKLKQHLVEASHETTMTAKFAATFLAALNYFQNPAGKLRDPDADDLEMLSQMYTPGCIDAEAIRSRCAHCALQGPCTIARALKVCESLCGKP